jgi:hypothetical protein
MTNAEKNRHADTPAEELMKGCNINVDFTRIDPQWWDVSVTEQSTKAHLTTYVGEILKNYSNERMWDEELLDAFQQQFEGWTKEMFNSVHFTYLRELKRLMRNRGINTGTITGNVPSQMSALLSRAPGELPDYDPTYLLKSSIEPQSQAYAQHVAAKRANPSGVQDNKQPVQPQGLDDAITSVEQQQHTQQQLQDHQSTLRGVNTPYPEARMSTPLQQNDPNLNDYTRLPPDEAPSENVDLRTITDFSKIYDTDKEYTGKAYDVLDDRMRLFFSICKSARISKGQSHAVFPRILTGEVEMYYFNNRGGPRGGSRGGFGGGFRGGGSRGKY